MRFSKNGCNEGERKSFVRNAGRPARGGGGGGFGFVMREWEAFKKSL